MINRPLRRANTAKADKQEGSIPMKWTEKETAMLRRMAVAGTPNGDIAKALNRPITEIYAKRSQLGITIDKVAKVAEPKQDKSEEGIASRVHTFLAQAETPEERCRLVQRIRTEAFARMVFGEITKARADAILDAVKAEAEKNV